MKQSRWRGIFGSCVILVFIVVACVGAPIETTVASTATICPPLYWTPSVERDPLFVFVLIDGTFGYFEKNYIEDVKEVLGYSLSKFLRTGDRVILGWIRDDTEYLGIEETIFYDKLFVMEAIDTTPTPTIPPSPTSIITSDLKNPTITPIGQLRQTEVARTVDAAKNIEAESLQKYFCTLGQAKVEIEQINEIIENIRVASASRFVDDINSNFPSNEEFENEEKNPVFESIALSVEFINKECVTESHKCVLLIFSNLQDYRSNADSNKLPYAMMNENINVLSVIFNCKYEGGCQDRIDNWDRHFTFFKAKSIDFILNRGEGEEDEDEIMGEDLSNAMSSIYTIQK